MENRQFEKLRLILGVLIFAVDCIILAIGLTHLGTVGYVVDGLAGLVFVLFLMVGAATD